MGATGAGKSKLAIDLASYFPIEIINADSMQVYKGLDVLTNKVPIQDQKGVPHHLLGSVDPNVEFTSKHFRDSAIQIIEDILSRDNLPVIVGGTNYYIQALVSPFLLDDQNEDMDDCCLDNIDGDEQPDFKFGSSSDESIISYDLLKELDPDAANRIHPNDYRKVNQYFNLYSRLGVLPSKIFQGKASEKWGRVDNFRYNCCFICVDASLPVLDNYVEQRVDCMVSAGLLNEVYGIYSLSADYTRGLRQAIGVREFEDFLKFHLNSESVLFINDKDYDTSSGAVIPLPMKGKEMLKVDLKNILDSDDSDQKVMLTEAIDKVKANTKRLVRRQGRRLNRLETLFGWGLHYVDATEALLSDTNDPWTSQVVEPTVEVIKSFYANESHVLDLDRENDMLLQRLRKRDLWTQHVCEACGNRILRGSHEWEQHKQGRGHRKRMVRLKKSKQFLVDRVALPTVEALPEYP